MNKAALSTVILVMAALSGCVTSGPSNTRDSSAMNRLSVGMNKAQVIEALGNPTSASAPGNGVECLDFMFFRVGQERKSWNEEDHFVILKNGSVSSYGQNDCAYIIRKGRY